MAGLLGRVVSLSYLSSFCTALREVLLSLRLRTMVVKISLTDYDRGSLLVKYLVQYWRTLWRDTMYCMCTLARHADSWTGLKLLIIPSFQAVRRAGSSSVTIAVWGCGGLG